MVFLFMACITFLVFPLLFLVVEVFLPTCTIHNRGKDIVSIIHEQESGRPPGLLGFLSPQH